MSTASEDILARKERYARIERVADTSGRLIGVKRLRPSQQLRVQELAPTLEGTTAVVDETTGKTFNIPKNTPLIIAASVVEIDSVHIPFPKTRGELDAILDRLDTDGLEAAGRALGAIASEAVSEDEAGLDVAKN